MIIITTTVWMIGFTMVFSSRVRSISIFLSKKDENYSENYRNTCSLNIVNKLIVKHKEYAVFIHCCALLLSLVFFFEIWQ